MFYSLLAISFDWPSMISLLRAISSSSFCLRPFMSAFIMTLPLALTLRVPYSFSFSALSTSVYSLLSNCAWPMMWSLSWTKALICSFSLSKARMASFFSVTTLLTYSTVSTISTIYCSLLAMCCSIDWSQLAWPAIISFTWSATA